MALSYDTCLHRQTCTVRLRAVGVTPFSPDGRDFGPPYERRGVGGKEA